MVGSTCKLCQQACETISHVLFQCSVAQQISNIPLPLNGFSTEVERNMEYILR